MLNEKESLLLVGPRAGDNVKGNRAFARSVLIMLPELTPAAVLGNPSVGLLLRLAISHARDCFRSDPSFGELLRSLSSYYVQLKRVNASQGTSDSIMGFATEIATRAKTMPMPKNTSEAQLSFAMILLFALAVVADLLVVIVIATSDQCCGSSESAAIALASLVAIIIFLLLGLTYQKLKRAKSDIKALDNLFWRLVESSLSYTPTEDRNQCCNTLSKELETGNEVTNDICGFLVDQEVVHQHKKAVNALLVDATDDDGDLTLRLRSLPPVSIGLGAVLQHLFVIVTDRDSKVVLWSEGAMALCGFSARDVEGKDIYNLLNGEKSVEQYKTMVGAADKNFDLSERALTLAHLTYGSVTINATVVSARDATTKHPVGYALIGSVREAGISRTLSLLHDFFVTELSHIGCKEPQFRQIVDCLQWKNLQELSSSAKEWGSVRLRAVLSEMVRERHRQMDVRVLPDVAELTRVSCDKASVVSVLSRAFGLLTGKLHIQVSLKRTTESVQQLVVVCQHDSTNPIDHDTLNRLVQAVNSLGGLLLSSSGTIRIQVPFIVEDGAGQPLLRPRHNLMKFNAKDPLIILLLEKNAVYRHNISVLVWSFGHSLRVVESVAKALQAVNDSSSDISCAIVDVDLRDAEKVLDGLFSQRIYTIETSETAKDPIKRGNSLLTKPICRDAFSQELLQAASKVEEKRRAEEEVMKRREIFGKVRNSPWICGRKLGRGAFADVYEATSTLTGGKMAVKMIRLSGKFEEKVKDLMNEIEILCKLTHPNIIHYFYCERAENTINLFMELADQGTVADLLRRYPRLPENHLLKLTRELLQAVNYLHECGIIHRDIKPGNMLISRGVLKLSDFGTATVNVGEGMYGTIFYMAPEVIEGRPSGKECDIWSIGCVVCECLQIKRPSRGGVLLGYGVPESFPPDISPELVDFIKACMHEDPSERASAGTLLLHDFIVKLDHEVDPLTPLPLDPMTTTWSSLGHTDRFTAATSDSAPSWSLRE
ncbi:mitogen activated kinase-like protein [Trypanosoma grayi]|uniref:mitogen activated kinase-like protein n=1 Tax=Trypanosoma grayi TaxID=71804 RepID=UPI0004F3F36B|nr:mitogen activated kinase-like protein [Trypanosoma grayi]KEG11669.1 mitogen activated kinase-like protein [Trypanosoma grayi]